MTDFTQFQLSEPILQALEKMGYKTPTPIQAKAIPMIQQGCDIIALAQTGSGKTATCAIPVCDRVDVSSSKIQALIVVPTRELALQYATETQKIGKLKNVKTFAIYGGEDAGLQESKLEHGVQVLIATPGRLIDFIYSRRIHLDDVKTLILDEADEMLSMGFYDDLEFIIQCLIQQHQTLLFSATMPKEIKKMAVQHMRDPQEVSLIDQQASPSKIDHRFLYCRHDHRNDYLAKQINELRPKQSIIFCHSRIEVEKVCGFLRRELKDVDFLHAGLNQKARGIITDKFRRGRIRHLVATDVAARGLDFSEVSHVFIYHLSDDPDIYVHRAGRTARAEREGMVVTMVTRRELSTLEKVLKRIGQEAKWIGEPPPNETDTAEARPKRKRRPPPRKNRT